MILIDDIKAQFRSGSSLMKIIYINAALFLIVKIVQVFAFLLNSPQISEIFLSYLAAPSSLPELATKPWTVVTYMFLHEGFLHILFNMLWLYWFGQIFLKYFNQKKLVSVYLLGGLAGALLYIISFNLFPVFTEVINISIALGASAAVIAVVVAIATYVPNYSVRLFLFGVVKIKYLAIAIILMTSLFDFSVNTGGKIAHIGGAVMGYLWAVNIKRGSDLGGWLTRLLDTIVTWFKPGKKMKVTYKKPKTDYEYNKTKADHQVQINKILEKISKGGYDSLTKEEKGILFKESQKKN